MSRGRKQTKAQKRARKQRLPTRTPTRKPGPPTDEDLVADTAANFTCVHNATVDFFEQCKTRLLDTDVSLTYGQLARDLWREREGRCQELVAILESFVAENQRHQAVISDLRGQLEAMLTGEDLHEHLDPPEAHYDFIRARLFPEEQAPAPADPSA